MLIDNQRLCYLCPSGKQEAGVLFSLNLAPGVNRVSKEDYERVKDAVSGYEARKEVLIVNKDGDDLRGSESTVVALVARTADVDLLRDWHDAKDAKGSPAHSKTVRKAIEQQVEALKIRKSE